MEGYEEINEIMQAFKGEINEIGKDEVEQIESVLKVFVPLLKEFSFEETCNWFEGAYRNIKELISERQKMTATWKTCVKEVEGKFLPVVKTLEDIKENCRKIITEKVLENEDKYRNEKGEIVCTQGNLCISEIEPDYEFTITDKTLVDPEFLKPNEETIKTHIDLFGEAPAGIEVKKIRRCKIVTKGING